MTLLKASKLLKEATVLFSYLLASSDTGRGRPPVAGREECGLDDPWELGALKVVITNGVRIYGSANLTERMATHFATPKKTSLSHTFLKWDEIDSATLTGVNLKRTL